MSVRSQLTTKSDVFGAKSQTSRAWNNYETQKVAARSMFKDAFQTEAAVEQRGDDTKSVRTHRSDAFARNLSEQYDKAVN